MKLKDNRLLPNEHIQRPDKKLDEWLRVPHTAGEYASVLRMGDKTLYDCSDTDNDFDENELLQNIEASQEVFTQFDTDRLKTFKNEFEKGLKDEE